MTTTRDVLVNALYEVGAFAQGETPPAGDTNFCLSKLNRLLDQWNSDKLFIYSTNFQQYVMTPAKNPQSIGKGFAVTSVALASDVATIVGVPSNPFFEEGDLVTILNTTQDGGLFNVTSVALLSVSTDGTTLTFSLTGSDFAQANDVGVVIPATTPASQAPDFPTPVGRPVKILNANIILTYSSGQPVRVPMRIVDNDWWANNRVPTIETTLPTHLYYQPEFPNGLLYFWPVPQIAYPVELNTWTQLLNLGLTDTFNLPPGYEDAVTYQLAVSICPAYGRPLDPTLQRLAREALGRIQSNNSATPNITTADYGVPGTSTDQRGRADFNWKTGNLAG